MKTPTYQQKRVARKTHPTTKGSESVLLSGGFLPSRGQRRGTFLVVMKEGGKGKCYRHLVGGRQGYCSISILQYRTAPRIPHERPQMATVVRFRNWALTSGLKAFRSRMTSWPLRIPSGSKTLRSAHLSQGDPVPATESFELKFIRGDSQHILRLPRKGGGGKKPCTHVYLPSKKERSLPREDGGNEKQPCFSWALPSGSQREQAWRNQPSLLISWGCKHPSATYPRQLPLTFR